MNEKEVEVYVGIDVSKDTLEVFVSGWSHSRRYKNNEKGMSTVVNELCQYKVKLVVIEATGGYEQAVVKVLQSNSIGVAVVNPRQTHNFARSLGVLAKTDPIDARMLMIYGEKAEPRETRKVSAAMEELQALNRRRSQLNAMLVQEKNHAKIPTLSADERQSIKETKKFINKQIRKVDELRSNLLEKDAELKAIYQVLDEQDGIACQGACVLMGDIPELGELNRGKIAALIGVAPFNRDSGTIEGKRRILGGRAGPRSLLYMLTLTGIRRNEHLNVYYRKLVKSGKAKKVAIVACMRKYLIYLNTKVGAVKTAFNQHQVPISA